MSTTKTTYAQFGMGAPSIVGVPAEGRMSDTFRIRETHPVSGRPNRPHNGIDIAVPSGTPLRSTISGQVTFSGNNPGGYGNYTIVTNPGGYQILYAHNTSNSIPVGGNVRAGDVLAISGNTGGSTGPHLHYEVRVEDPNNPGNYIAINPESAQGLDLSDPNVQAMLIEERNRIMGDTNAAANPQGGDGGTAVAGETSGNAAIIGCDEDISEQTTDRVDALMEQQFEAANSVITQPTPVEQLTCFDQTTEIFSEIGGIHSDPEQGNIDDSIVPNVQQPLMQQMQQFLTGNIAGGINDVINNAFSNLTGGLGGGAGGAGNCDMMDQAWLIGQCIEMPQIPSLGDIIGGQMGDIMGQVGSIAGSLGNPERLLEQVCSMANSTLQGYFGDLNESFTSAAEGALNPITDVVGGN